MKKIWCFVLVLVVALPLFAMPLMSVSAASPLPPAFTWVEYKVNDPKAAGGISDKALADYFVKERFGNIFPYYFVGWSSRPAPGGGAGSATIILAKTMTISSLTVTSTSVSFNITMSGGLKLSLFNARNPNDGNRYGVCIQCDNVYPSSVTTSYSFSIGSTGPYYLNATPTAQLPNSYRQYLWYEYEFEINIWDSSVMVNHFSIIMDNAMAQLSGGLSIQGLGEGLQSQTDELKDFFENGITEEELAHVNEASNSLDSKNDELAAKEDEAWMAVDDALNDVDFDIDYGNLVPAFGLIGDTAQRMFESLGGYKVFVIFPLILGTAMLIIGVSPRMSSMKYRAEQRRLRRDGTSDDEG